MTESKEIVQSSSTSNNLSVLHNDASESSSILLSASAPSMEEHGFKKILNRLSGQPESYNRKSRYIFGRTLGAGSFGIVRYARDTDTGEDVAVKIIIKKALKGNEDFVIEELELLQELHHPHIVGFRDWFQSKDKFYIVTQLATGGELFERIVQQGRFTEHDASLVVIEMLEAIQYLHNKNIVHRDIKPENVLYLNKDQNSNIVLADFGIAKRLQSPEEKIILSAGSFGYAAPEVVKGKGHGKPCDIWSLGVVTYTLLCGYSPFRLENVADFIAEVRHNNAVIFHADYWRDVSKDARRFIIRALQYDPEVRATADQLLSDPWLISIASEHKHTDLLPTLKENFNARAKFRQAIDIVRLANKIKKLKQMENVSDDDEIDLFNDSGEVASKPTENAGGEASLDSPTEQKYGLKNEALPLLQWKDVSEALTETTSESSSSLAPSRGSVENSLKATNSKSDLTTSAFQHLVKLARDNKDRVVEYQEESDGK